MDQNMTLIRYLPVVLERTPCPKHNAVTGVPCFDIFSDRGILPGICDRRARKAGFNAHATLKSIGKG